MRGKRERLKGTTGGKEVPNASRDPGIRPRPLGVPLLCRERETEVPGHPRLGGLSSTQRSRCTPEDPEKHPSLYSEVGLCLPFPEFEMGTPMQAIMSPLRIPKASKKSIQVFGKRHYVKRQDFLH